MTHGQMAPTSLPGQVTTTSPYGRDPETAGLPIKICEMLSQLDGPQYFERVAVNNPRHVLGTKKAILKSFRRNAERKGFSLVEVLSTCPTNWGMSPKEALNWVEEKMIPIILWAVIRRRVGCARVYDSRIRRTGYYVFG